ncbi:hypothetical protein LUZ60_001133 [Juncus effusus]|nr:hypothetical protein LUZ60_001133 [Juncus effusus]
MEVIRQWRGRGYGKVHSGENHAIHRASKRGMALIVVSMVILLAIVLGLAIAISSTKDHSKYGHYRSQSPAATIKLICSVTRYPDLCVSTISPVNASYVPNDPIELFKLSLEATMDKICNVSSLIGRTNFALNDKRLGLAIEDCKELIDNAIDDLNYTISLLDSKLLTDSMVSELRALLSAVITDQETCIDGFEGTSGSVKDKFEIVMDKSTKLTSNSLAIANDILGILQKLGFKTHRKLLATNENDIRRKLYLLRDPTQLTPNVTVAKDGSGLVRTISEAIRFVPLKSKDPFVIHVKLGVYRENVIVSKEKWNVILVGDGMNETIVDGSLNFDDGTPTFSTATFAVDGKRFMAKDIGFRNSAGPQKHQAVAFRSSSDQSVFYRCSFDGFQNTLFTHSFCQFYRDCDITGTIDIIFGDAAAVFQNCTIRPKQGLPGQHNKITAQAKNDPNESTGFSIQGCFISPYNDSLMTEVYLGRPMKNYSTVMIMQSKIGSFVDPKGWDIPSELNRVLYSEYMNTGPGSNVADRVKWVRSGSIVTCDEAEKYTVESFLKGSEWIPETGIEFKSSLD